MAPVTEEYVPAKASDEEYGLVDSKTSSQVKSRREKTRRFYGGENTFTVERGDVSFCLVLICLVICKTNPQKQGMRKGCG